MTHTEEIINKGNKYLMATYARLPVVFQRGEDYHLWDVEGKEYLDFIAGYGVCSVGHSHPRVVEAIVEQAREIIQPSNLFYNCPQVELAELLSRLTMGGRSFLANSGAEANEAAIKLARKYSRQKLGENRYEIITAYNSFHGRTLATLAATGQPSKQKPFEPLTPGFKHVPFNNVEEMAKAISEKSCAVMIEPIQGEGGVIVPDQSFLGEVRKLCDDRNLLLIIDEIQTGIGRTGELFAYQHYGIEPDILTLAKGLGGGVPIGVMVARDSLWEVFDVGSHGSTFGGNALACAAALATLRTVLEEDLPSRAKRTGEFFLEGLKELHRKWPQFISQVRGKGLMLAMEFKEDLAQEIVRQGLEEGLVLNGLTPRVIRFLPPLTIEESAIERLIDFLNQVLIKLEKQH